MDTNSNGHVRPKTINRKWIRTQEPGYLIPPERTTTIASRSSFPATSSGTETLCFPHFSYPRCTTTQINQLSPPFTHARPGSAPQQQSRPGQEAKPLGPRSEGRISQACKKITGRQQCWGWPLTLPAPSGPGARRLMSPFPHSRSSMAVVCSICQPTGPGPRIVEFPLPPDYLIVQPAPAPVATPRWPRDSPTWPHWGSWEGLWMMGNLVRLDNAPFPLTLAACASFCFCFTPAFRYRTLDGVHNSRYSHSLFKVSTCVTTQSIPQNLATPGRGPDDPN
ncbi:hypothetical protein CNYM01_12000 [Colletotrichum nymphaeae SA-01]|uniref:Uncharacterized protein n=1 Tax=Colletotrichum nymphaeae SA-01 TaxID=1460502 RepID=A0A135UDN5_9PEZI|nr:hypothetical protein CNYM01_12000 [Colletotrichum nymphaeae SA-01]